MSTPEGKKARYEYLKSRHRCAKCAGQDAYTLNGRAYCAECIDRMSERQRVYISRHREQHNAYNRAYRDKCKAAGLCVRCRKPAVRGKTMCAVCAAKDNARHRKKPCELIDREEWVDQGMCRNCRKPVKEGESVWSGRPFRLCPDCYDKAVDNLIKAHAAYREAHGGRSWMEEFYYQTWD